MGVITQEQISVCSQKIRQEYVKISILNSDNLIIDEIEGKVISGSINITNDSFIRRSCSLKLLLDKTLLPNQYSLLKINNQLKLEMGIKNLLTNEIIYFSMGIYLFKSTQMSYSSSDNSLSLECLDKMCNFDGTLGGILENDIKITNQGVSVSEAIRSIVVQLGGENPNNVLIEDFINVDTGQPYTVPYTISKQSGSNILDIIKEISNLYKGYTCYYNELGNFVAERTKVLLSDMVALDFRDTDYTITSQVTNSYDYIKNKVKVYGISVTPMVAVQETQTPSNPNPVNNSTSLRITFNKPLYDSVGNKITDGTNLTSYFEYNGTTSNYISAIYNASLWQVTFQINGENGKILSPKANMIYDAYQMPFSASSFIYSSKDGSWSPLLKGTVITDGVTNTTQFKLEFNKPLYNQSGTAIATNTSLKSAFIYSDGSGNSNNFLDAVYVINSTEYYILLTFTSPIPNATIEINKDGIINPNSVYDSSGTIYQPQSFIMDGNTWTLVEDTSNLLTYQITAEASNTDDTSPYSINNIGERLEVVNDQNIYNLAQAQSRALYELQIHSNLNEQISLSCLSLLYLDVNKLIYLSNEVLGVEGKYRIDKVGFDLKSGVCSLTCVKLYM